MAKGFPKIVATEPGGEEYTLHTASDEANFRADHPKAVVVEQDGKRNAAYDVKASAVRETASGLRRIDAREAAEVIRQDIGESPALDPRLQHSLKYCTEVCNYLQLDPNPVNLQRVADALKDAGIEPGHPAEFPKYVVVGQDAHGYDVSVIVENADQEAEAASGKGPLAEHALAVREVELQTRDVGKTKDQLEAEATLRERTRERNARLADQASA